MKIALLGATGSIGKQVLEVVHNRPQFKLVAISAHTNIDELNRQQKAYSVPYVAISSGVSRNGINKEATVFSGENWYKELIDASDADIVLIAVMGFAGLLPAYYSLQLGKKLLLANKEAIVSGGSILTVLAKEKGTQIIPIDSEHSAIFQCLQGEETKNIRKVHLTASGGPFLNFSEAELATITPEQAIQHPVWKMGAKISVDSATLMNKGLEAIEAHWLFGLKPEQIDFVIHPSALVHSLVEFVDGSIKAQLSYPDMRIPIRYALSYPDRFEAEVEPFKWQNMVFKELNKEQFPSINLAMQVLEQGGSAACILNAANEAAVQAFINKKITFAAIIEMVNDALNNISSINNPSLDDLILTYTETVNYINSKI